MSAPQDNTALFEAIQDIINEKIPFNKVLGLQAESLGFDRVEVRFDMREELIGNYIRGTLHGGVISSVIDLTGGLAAFMGIQKN
jgi:acyl-coenzyme A thioesterase PaaI-like protein